MKTVVMTLALTACLVASAEIVLGLGDPEKMTMADRREAYNSHRHTVSVTSGRLGRNSVRRGNRQMPEPSDAEANAWFVAYTNNAAKMMPPSMMMRRGTNGVMRARAKARKLQK